MAGDEATRMFVGQPQPVEIHHRGIWYSGELIGWRHERDGRVAARVRCRVDGLRHSAWVDLADLRLPDPERPPYKEPFPAVVRRPVPVGGRDEDDDATRPHSMLAAMRTRPAKPAHVVQPPTPVAHEGTGAAASRHEAAAGMRRNPYLRNSEAQLSVI